MADNQLILNNNSNNNYNDNSNKKRKRKREKIKEIDSSSSLLFMVSENRTIAVWWVDGADGVD